FTCGNRFIGLGKYSSSKTIAFIGRYLNTDVQGKRLQIQFPGFLGIQDYSFKDYGPKRFSVIGLVLYIVFGDRDILAPKIVVLGVVQGPKIGNIYGRSEERRVGRGWRKR